MYWFYNLIYIIKEIFFIFIFIKKKKKKKKKARNTVVNNNNLNMVNKKLTMEDKCLKSSKVNNYK